MVVRTVQEFNSESFNFDWNTKRPHASTVSKFKVLTLTGIPKDRMRLRYPNLKFTLKNIQNKKYIKFSKLKNIKHFNN